MKNYKIGWFLSTQNIPIIFNDAFIPELAAQHNNTLSKKMNAAIDLFKKYNDSRFMEYDEREPIFELIYDHNALKGILFNFAPIFSTDYEYAKNIYENTPRDDEESSDSMVFITLNNYYHGIFLYNDNLKYSIHSNCMVTNDNRPYIQGRICSGDIINEFDFLEYSYIDECFSNKTIYGIVDGTIWIYILLSNYSKNITYVELCKTLKLMLICEK